MGILLILQLHQIVLLMHMFKINFDIPAKKAKVVIPQLALESKSEFCEFLFEEEKSIPSGITDFVQQLEDKWKQYE